MKYKFIKEEIKYTGKELSPHWIYKNFNIEGSAVVSFIGECDVELDNMLDIEDVLNNEPIYSKKMLHFIAEEFNIPLTEGVLRQRLLVCAAKEVLENCLSSGERILRKGDDLYYKNGKLSVSIAAKSLNSVLIHLGLNIDSNGTPVKASGLETDMKLNDFYKIADDIMNYYCSESEQIMRASCKVRGVY